MYVVCYQKSRLTEGKTLSPEIIKTDKIPIYNFSKIVHDLELNPPYQRGEAWTEEMKANLICSIVYEVPIGVVHLVRFKENANKKFVLDGKQRTIAITGFLNNEFRIDVKKSDGKKVKMTFSDLEKSDDKNMNQIADKILGYNLTYIEYAPMEILEQKTLFERINTFSNLNAEEKIYCSNYHAKRLIEWVIQDSDLIKVFSQTKDKKIKKDSRFSATRLVHHVLLLCFGKDFKSRMTNIADVSAQDVTESALNIHNLFVLSEFNHLRNIDDDVLKEIGFLQNYRLFKQVSSKIHSILTFNSHNSKSISKVDIQDLFVFLINKCQNGEITPSYISEKLSDFNKLFFDYIKQKADENEAQAAGKKEMNFTNKWSQGTTVKSMIEKRLALLDGFYQKNDNIDKQKKNKEIPLSKKIELENSLPICSKTGKLLSEDEMSLDHIHPKSISSNADDARIMSKEQNARRGNWVETEK